MFFIYILFGHLFILGNIYSQKGNKLIILITIFLFGIPYFFLQIIINIIMLFPYIIKESFNSFIYQFYYNVMFNRNKFHRFHKITKTAINLGIILFIGIYIGVSYIIYKYIINKRI